LDFFDAVPFPVVLICAFSALMIPVGFGLSYWNHQRTITAWTELASRTGLTFSQKAGWLFPPVLSGDFRGRPIVLTYVSRGSGKSRTYYTQVTLQVRNPAFNKLRLTRSNVIDSIGKAFGAQDVLVGDDAFDQAFTIKSQPPEFAMNVLGDSMLRSDLMRTEHGWITLDGNSLVWETRNVQRDSAYLERILSTLSDLADTVEKEGR
jgi:hypothetical protein